MSGLSKEQAEEIFLLTRETHTLGRKRTCDFIQLSHKEALFCMGVQATGYEKATSGRPWPCYSILLNDKIWGEGALAEKLNEAIDHLWEEAGKAWLDTNSILFHHALEYQNKMSDFLTESGEAIEALHDRIWKVVMKVMEDAGNPWLMAWESLCLVDMLPTIPLQLAFHSATPGLTGFVPEVYAARPKSRMDILDFSHAPPPAKWLEGDDCATWRDHQECTWYNRREGNSTHMVDVHGQCVYHWCKGSWNWCRWLSHQ